MSRYYDTGRKPTKRGLERRKKRKAFFQKLKAIRGKGFKAMCWLVEIHALFCISFSYYLAATERINPLETLSSTIVTEIIAPIVVMGFSRTIENIFEHNELSFSKPIKKNEEEAVG